MKTILDKLPDDKAQKELKQFTIAACVLSGVSIFMFWFIGVAGLALGARALLLTWHKANKNRKDLARYRVPAAAAVALGLLSTLYGLGQ